MAGAWEVFRVASYCWLEGFLPKTPLRGKSPLRTWALRRDKCGARLRRTLLYALKK
jgi:hypothetical protein